MPAKPTWYRKIRRICALVEATSTPFLDRAAIEKAFELRARSAQQLMLRIGSERLGGALVVQRDRVLLFLRSAERGLPYLQEVTRRRRVAEVLQEERLGVKARAVRFPLAAPREQGRTIEGLPGTIRIAPGELRIQCSDARDLFQQLYELSRAIAQNYDRFEGLIGTPGRGLTP